MKRLLTLVLFTVLSLTANSQVKFLGIPVDGPKSEMINKIKAKGFKYDAANDFLVGNFNGITSHIYVVADRYNKVYRIYVVDEDTFTESQIINRFNRLYNQFKNNDKYVLYGGDEIDYSEDISYQMSSKNKTYAASFFQLDDKLNYYYNLKYSPSNYSKIHNEAISIVRRQGLIDEYNGIVKEMTIEDNFYFDIRVIVEDIKFPKNDVWFRIFEYYGEYYIGIYYDNLLNAPNGQDL